MLQHTTISSMCHKPHYWVPSKTNSNTPDYYTHHNISLQSLAKHTQNHVPISSAYTVSITQPQQPTHPTTPTLCTINYTEVIYQSSCCRSPSDKDCFHHLTVALHLALCCESDVQESIFMSLSFRFVLDGILEPETRAPSLSLTRRQLGVDNLLW